MWTFIAVAVVGLAVWFGGGQRAWRNIRMGAQLTRMANVFEAIEQTRYTHPVGAGGGIDSLPPRDQMTSMITLKQGLEHLRQFPRHVVTREAVKNMKVAESFGRTMRVRGMMRLLDFLVENDVALGRDEFLASYA